MDETIDKKSGSLSGCDAISVSGRQTPGRRRTLPAAFLLGAMALVAANAQEIPRLPDGRPNFNGVWSVMNTANYDLEPHAARAALQLRDGPYNPVPARSVLALGAVGAVPAGPGVVVGGAIPYTDEARRGSR